MCLRCEATLRAEGQSGRRRLPTSLTLSLPPLLLPFRLPYLYFHLLLPLPPPCFLAPFYPLPIMFVFILPPFVPPSPLSNLACGTAAQTAALSRTFSPPSTPSPTPRPPPPPAVVSPPSLPRPPLPRSSHPSPPHPTLPSSRPRCPFNPPCRSDWFCPHAQAPLFRGYCGLLSPQ